MGFFGDLYGQADAITGGYLPGGYRPSQVSATDALKTAALAPLTPLYALGGGLNVLSGGTTTAWTPGAAIVGGVQGTTYSTLTQAASGYFGPDPSQPIPPGGGSWGVPVLNPALPAFVGQVVGGVVEGISDGLGLPPWLLPAAGIGGLLLWAA